MAGPIHICRDLFTSITGGNGGPLGQMYVASVYLFGVLSFTQVGQTGFNLSGSSLQIASGLSASLSLPVSGAYAVSIPSAAYTVSSNDVGRILALRSDLNPAFNSGLFHVTAISSSMNALLIDYRSADNPTVETQTLKWGIFANENALGSTTGFGGTPSGPGGYQSRGAGYSGKRIILQSPHSSGWQVRFCYESTTDRNNMNAKLSTAPGFGGDTNGDFPSGSLDNSKPLAEHLHTPMWFDVSNSNYLGTVVDLDVSNGANNNNGDDGPLVTRFYAWGDSLTGSVCFVWRNVTNYVDGWTTFGMAEDDEPAPPRVSQRLFTFGRDALAPDLVWDSGPHFGSGYPGVTFGLNLKPVSCVRSPYTYVASTNTRIRSLSIAVDNAMLGATELQRLDLWAGTQEMGWTHANWPAYAVYDYDPRRMGSFPIARQGRANFGTWSTTSDSQKAWYHTKNGIFFPWAGPTPYQ